jgi:hypothetical protein
MLYAGMVQLQLHGVVDDDYEGSEISMSEYISTDGYEIHFDLEQSNGIQVIDMKTERVMYFTAEEAINMLVLMYKYSEELRAVRMGR